MQPKMLQKFQWLEENKILFPEEFSFVHASIYEPDLSDYLIAFR